MRQTDEGSEGGGGRRARAPFLLRRVLRRGIRLDLLAHRRDVLLVRRRGRDRGRDARRHGVGVASPSRHLRGLGTDGIDRRTTRRTRARARTTPDARRDPGRYLRRLERVSRRCVSARGRVCRATPRGRDPPHRARAKAVEVPETPLPINGHKGFSSRVAGVSGCEMMIRRE